MLAQSPESYFFVLIENIEERYVEFSNHFAYGVVARKHLVESGEEN